MLLQMWYILFRYYLGYLAIQVLVLFKSLSNWNVSLKQHNLDEITFDLLIMNGRQKQCIDHFFTVSLHTTKEFLCRCEINSVSFCYKADLNVQSECGQRLLEKKDSNIIRKEKLKSATISTRMSAYTALVAVSQSQPNSASS